MFGAVSLTVDLLFRNIVMKIDVIRQHDVSHKSADFFDGCDSFNFVLCASKKVLWYWQSVDKGRC